ncbi:hypothetical protein [Pseudanabaena minima]|uniref:hypothetical protein n=1 Tax=Pseudanabaena minima TaxID=890415 RepID=UPI003DA7B1EB
MRGAARVGGRAWRVPQEVEERTNPFDFDPFEMIPSIGDLPVAPALEPINDEWSISNFNEPVDAKDCAKYPASPYCENEWIDPFGSPFGVEPELRSNGCETCFYVYPIIMWMKLQPTIVCRRDPNCGVEAKPSLNKDPITKNKPKPYDENPPITPFRSPECAFREGIINRYYNWLNNEVGRLLSEEPSGNQSEYRNLSVSYLGAIRMTAGVGEIVNDNSLEFDLGYPFEIPNSPNYVYHYVGDLHERIYMMKSFEVKAERGNVEWIPQSRVYYFVRWKPIPCPDRPRPKKVTPPPPRPLPTGRGKKMSCCNECADAKDNTDKLLKEIKEIKKVLGSGKLDKALNAAVGIGDESNITTIANLLAKRLGTNSYPIEVPESLLQGTGDKVKKLESNAEFLHWLTYQFDGLVGQFPIDVEVKDIDPLKEGDQNKTIQLPNLAEAIAEIYGLVIKSSVNQEVELNMLLRLAAEAIATKNAAVVTQDYARANALFLGYKANFKPRELQYNFDFTNANLDPRSKEPIVLEKLLRTVKGYVQGWQLEDKETVVGFLQKLMFSAGIIKAVFFRGKGQQKELQREINSMANDEKAQEAKFEAFIKEINDPNSRFNKDSVDKPEIKDETPPDSKGAR